ncbi:MAG TPA: heterodisulfide reductase-related iron-sulfur binding cluster [Candidatus Limnocylindrales bacterium]|nr:heterodisulfide reductase-related iron-sulfur binding cluster [Candidatus Limnocylindrales bacterium]
MTDVTWGQRALILVLMLTSLGLFWMRLRGVLRAIRASKPTADFEVAPVGRRVRQFLWEVALQGKVIRERPLPGLAHAFVFWGFCAFALITMNHFAAGFGVAFLSPASGFGRLYFGFVAVWAILVIVGIVGLFVRRFLVRPRWLGAVSPESGVIAFLIFALMVTYLGMLWYGEGSTGGKVNWWLHTIAILAFLPLIPHTKHLHLALSPVTVFLRRAGFSRIPPLEGDEDFGLDTGKDVTRIDALQAFSCVECGRCTEHCPANNTGKILNPKTIILGLRGYLNQEGPGNEAPLVGTHISEEAVFQCTSCGGCEYQCPVGIQHLPIIIGLRRGLVNTGKWENEYGGKLFLNLERNGNSLGFPAAERQKFIEKAELPIYDGTQEYCFWLGCMGAYDPQGREIVQSMARVLRHAGVTFGVLKKERCTGDPARRLGNDLAVSQVAEQNIETLRAAKVGKMVSICPHCVRTIGTDWREFGGTFEIEHHSEVLARLQDKLPRGESREKVVFHDPCYLGRYRDVYEQPRQVAALGGGEVVDPERARERSFCCGAGGGQMFLGEEKGKRVNVERVEQLLATGAQTIGTACPFCQTMFRDALGAVKPAEMPKLLDIVQIVAAGLPPENPAPKA